MYVATLDTEHYSFIAIGRSRAQALEAMVATLAAHRAQTGAWEGEDLAETAEYYGCRIVGPLKAGAAGTRDGSSIRVS